MSKKVIEQKEVDLLKGVCFPQTDRKALSHSEVVQMSMEGYPMESAQNMAYDPENVDTSAGRLDTFRMDWFDAAQVSQEMQLKAPVATKPIEDEKVEDEEVKAE